MGTEVSEIPQISALGKFTAYWGNRYRRNFSSERELLRCRHIKDAVGARRHDRRYHHR